MSAPTRRHQIHKAIAAMGPKARAVAICAIFLLLLPTAASAQDAQVQGLIDRIDRLQRELITLQRQVYRGENPPPAAELPAETAVPPSTALARLELRLSQFENEMRTLTGQIEEAAFRYNQVSERLDRLAADLEVRLQRLEQATPGLAAAPGTAPGAAPGSTGSLTPPTASGPAPASGTPGVIGTVDPAQLEALRSQQAAGTLPPATDTGSQQAALAPGGTPKEQYDHAFGLLSQANYDDAEVALRAFVEQHPTDPLAGNAKYWLGETYYVRGDYQQAAVAFAEAYQEYPDNPKAPDNLLKLGLALGAMGNKADACGTLAELQKRYKSAAVTVIQRAKQEQQRLGC